MFRIILITIATLACAVGFSQPLEFQNISTSGSALIFSTRVEFEGLPAATGDWVGAFDSDYNCAGAGLVSFNMMSGFALTGFNVYRKDGFGGGQIDCTPGCEPFTLVLWRSSLLQFFHVPSPAMPTMIPYVDANVDGFVDNYSSANAAAGVTLNFNGPALDPALLPVELLFFRGAPKASDVLLEWATASEQNNDFFELQRSVDGREFEVLGKVPGAGTHSGLLTYEFTDRSPRTGVNYYRLRQVDFDGAFEYSSIISVKAAGKEGAMALYPNPAGEYVEVRLPADWSEGEKELLLRDVSGRVLRKMQYSNVDGPLRVSTEGLPGGYYTLQASNGREVLSERVVVMRQ